MKPRAVVDTNSGNDSPGSTLACPAYPSISCSAPRCLITQSEVPGSEFSGTAAAPRRAAAAADGRGAAAGGGAHHAAAGRYGAGRGRRGQAEEGPPAGLSVHAR